jgi:hypothetical protein
MLEQHTPVLSSTTSPRTGWPSDGVILDWIAAWQPAREDVLGLLNAYAEADGGHDISSFTPLIEQLDTAMRLLNHRVDWLRSYLGHCAPKTQNLD